MTEEEQLTEEEMEEPAEAGESFRQVTLNTRF